MINEEELNNIIVDMNKEGEGHNNFITANSGGLMLLDLHEPEEADMSDDEDFGGMSKSVTPVIGSNSSLKRSTNKISANLNAIRV